MTISFTRAEIEVLFNELGMLVESCDLCEEEGKPRDDDAQIRAIFEKARRARRETNRTGRVSKWERFRES